MTTLQTVPIYGLPLSIPTKHKIRTYIIIIIIINIIPLRNELIAIVRRLYTHVTSRKRLNTLIMLMQNNTTL